MLKVFKITRKVFLVLIVIFFLAFLLSRGHVYKKEELEYGVTFSKKQAVDLGFDWQRMYLSILDDLGVKKIRLPAYWNEIETTENQYSWQDLDWQIEKATARQVEIVVAVGGRLPRWPECHFPDWTKDYTKGRRQTEILNYIEKVITRYRDNKQIVAWQVENEPFLSHFGDCPKLDEEFLDEEIALVRRLDQRPIIVTDSGELSVWIPAAKRADIFGTTMYRDTYSGHLKMYVHYPIAPGFFRFKKNIASLFAQPKEWIVIELQAEPWGPKPYQDLTKQEQDRTMNLDKFKQMIEFARQAGFREFYLWGVEWWYYEMSQGRPEIWQFARTLFGK